MRHTIIEKKVEPELWTNPVPVHPEEIPVLGKEDYEGRDGQALGNAPGRGHKTT